MPRISAERTDVMEAALYVDKGLHIKRTNSWIFILAFVSSNKLCLHALYKTDSKSVHAPSTFISPVPQEA